MGYFYIIFDKFTGLSTYYYKSNTVANSIELNSTTNLKKIRDMINKGEYTSLRVVNNPEWRYSTYFYIILRRKK